jgi:hypothetical protein
VGPGFGVGEDDAMFFGVGVALAARNPVVAL